MQIRKQLTFVCLVITQLLVIYSIIKTINRVYKPINADKNTTESGIHFNTDITEVLTIASNLNIKLFIVEPQRLINYLNEEDIVLLDKCDNSSHIENEYSVNRIQFGVFESKFNISNNQIFKLLNDLKLNGFQCVNPLAVHQSDSQSEIVNKTVYRYLCTKDDSKIHIIKFLRKNEFYLIKELNYALIYTGSYFDNQLLFESAFDDFDLQNISYSAGIYWLPKELLHFLAQTKTSRFIECDRKQLRDNYLNDTKLRNKLRAGIIAMKRMMNKELKQVWLSCGTLLGWYRQCGVFAHANDIDFTTWHKYASIQFTKRLMNNTEGLFLKHIFGFIDEAYEMSFRLNGLKIDLFYNYIFGNRYAIATHKVKSHMYSWYYQPMYKLCSADLLAIRVNVPCDPLVIIINEFGHKWYIPIKSWDYFYSPFNRGRNQFWSNDRKMKAIQEF